MQEFERKSAGAYYTPEMVAVSLVGWVVRNETDHMLDPSCGDGRFIMQHSNSVGIERDGRAAQIAKQRAPHSSVYEGDFFAWASETSERFDCAAGNPPFIRYQSFKGETRERALALCNRLGANFSGLTSSWAPFLVAAASTLVRGGCMAFVVPAEIGHAPYAAPLLEYLVAHFETVHVIAVREKIFPDLSEDCWLLYADGFGSVAREIAFTALARFEVALRPPKPTMRISLKQWRTTWKRRLRPFLLPESTRSLYHEVASLPDTRRFGDVASIGIGYVSGDNTFFHLKPSKAAAWEIPYRYLHPTVRNGRMLPAQRVSTDTVENWRRADDPILLLRISRSERHLPIGIRRYLDTDEGMKARDGYKCRNREPWYSVPDVQVPDFFLTYMSGREVSLVSNEAGCTCTNSVHSVRLKDRKLSSYIRYTWSNPFVRMSCEIEGHPLGGGMLKLEPREATAILLPGSKSKSMLDSDLINESIAVMHSWRHYGAGAKEIRQNAMRMD